jgi:hypothetical protein
VVLFLAVAGCGGGKPAPKLNEDVEGTVTMDGEPLGGVMITFAPLTDGSGPAPNSNATTDDSGHFKLVADGNRPGAMIAKHKVTLTRGRAADPKKGEQEQPSEFKDKRPVPAIYKPGNPTKLQVEVTADKHTGYDFSIQSTDK